MTLPENEEPQKRYAIRFVADAAMDLDAAFHHLVDTAGFDLAQEWRARLAQEILSLATNPTRFPLAPENRHFSYPARQLVWRRTVSSVAYRVLFWIAEEEGEAPTVAIFHIRHGSARPITRKEAKQIQGSQGSP